MGSRGDAGYLLVDTRLSWLLSPCLEYGRQIVARYKFLHDTRPKRLQSETKKKRKKEKVTARHSQRKKFN